MRLYAYKTRFSFAKTMVLERFRNVVEAILNTEITKISGLRPDSSQNPFSIASIINKFRMFTPGVGVLLAQRNITQVNVIDMTILSGYQRSTKDSSLPAEIERREY